MAEPYLVSSLDTYRKRARALAVGIAWCDRRKLGLHQSTGSETVQQLADHLAKTVRSNPPKVVKNGVDPYQPRRAQISDADALRRSSIRPTLAGFAAVGLVVATALDSTLRRVVKQRRPPHRAFATRVLTS
jgi:hypothetical protein